MNVTINVPRVEITIRQLIEAYAEATGVKYLSEEDLDNECHCKIGRSDSCMNDGMFHCTMTKKLPDYFKNKEIRKLKGE